MLPSSNMLGFQRFCRKSYFYSFSEEVVSATGPFQDHWKNKSCTRETLNLSAYADKSTDIFFYKYIYMVRNHQDEYTYLKLLFFLKISRHLFLGVNWIGQWIPRHDWRGIARDIKNSNFHFQHSTKDDNKVGTINKAEM